MHRFKENNLINIYTNYLISGIAIMLLHLNKLFLSQNLLYNKAFRIYRKPLMLGISIVCIALSKILVNTSMNKVIQL